jgi:hypothetical protein
MLLMLPKARADMLSGSDACPFCEQVHVWHVSAVQVALPANPSAVGLEGGGAEAEAIRKPV